MRSNKFVATSLLATLLMSALCASAWSMPSFQEDMARANERAALANQKRAQARSSKLVVSKEQFAEVKGTVFRFADEENEVICYLFTPDLASKAPSLSCVPTHTQIR